MSWLFGMNQRPQDFSQFVPPPAGAAGGDGGPEGPNDRGRGNSSMEAYRFDSAALERAAKAAKDLEKSAFAKEALSLSLMQEETKQKEIMTKAKEMEVQIEAAKAEGKRIEQEERRKTLQEQSKLDQQKSQYQDQLSRKRYEDQLAQQQRMNEDNLKRQEESIAKQEAMRKATIEHELEQRHKYDLKRIDAEMTSKAKVDRENQDLTLEQIRVRAAEDRETTLKSMIEKRETILSSIKTAGAAIGTGIDAFLSEPRKIQAAVAGLVALTAGYYGAKGSLGVIFRFMEARLAKPSLVRETSRVNAFDVVRHPVQTVKKIQKRPEDVLEGVVLNPSLEERVRDIAIATKNTKFNKGMYRNILLHGPPGTGKTLFAKKLAMHSGMDYAIMTGGDIALLGRESVGAIHKVFDWAGTSRKGLILFIDEAEGFLRKRHENISEELRMAISAFLYRTGTQTDKFMMVLASNTPEVLDFAVVDRVHEPVEFPLPTLVERERLVRLYFEKYILMPAAEGKRRLKVAEFDYSAACTKVAKLTEGMSGREITNMALDWQMTTYASRDGVFSEEIMLKRAEAAVQHKKHKVSWRSAHETKKTVFSAAVIAAVENEASAPPSKPEPVS
ncbi:ATPase family AAA domain-containing protein 3-A-like [Penaeus japonicus]|uniref:ATPase family AAA domain-containing protein 3-A-like n=1 Tax=Penaeus japonicus TaxID=27405 RepID=UPI001C712DCB|nr:ATPase family AAA domain-containing protein 3-A-like [Penaeus japonicus]